MRTKHVSCDLLKIHYLCGDKDNGNHQVVFRWCVVICSKFITFAVTKTTVASVFTLKVRCDLLKIHYLCGDKDNALSVQYTRKKVVICSKFITFAVTKTTGWWNRIYNRQLWFAQNSLPLRWQRQLFLRFLKRTVVVICSKFITFAVTKTTQNIRCCATQWLWFAQNSLPLRWQRQPVEWCSIALIGCDLLKIHYLCGDKDNPLQNA